MAATFNTEIMTEIRQGHRQQLCLEGPTSPAWPRPRQQHPPHPYGDRNFRVLLTRDGFLSGMMRGAYEVLPFRFKGVHVVMKALCAE